MTYLLIIWGLMFLAFTTGLFIVVGNWQMVAVTFGLLLGIAWFAAVEGRWLQRLHIQWMRLSLRLLLRETDKTVAEMVDAWHDDPGGERWYGLDAWLSELHIERYQLRQRIQDATYKLGLEKY